MIPVCRLTSKRVMTHRLRTSVFSGFQGFSNVIFFRPRMKLKKRSQSLLRRFRIVKLGSGKPEQREWSVEGASRRQRSLPPENVGRGRQTKDGGVLREKQVRGETRSFLFFDLKVENSWAYRGQRERAQWKRSGGWLREPAEAARAETLEETGLVCFLNSCSSRGSGSQPMARLSCCNHCYKALNNG